MNNSIEIILKVKDQASPALRGFASKLGSLKGAAIGLAGGVGLGLALRSLVRNVVEAEQAALKLDVAYRNMGGGLGRTRAQLDELANSLQRTTTASDDTVKEAQALLLTFDQVRGDAFERTIRVANDMSALLGEDLVSVTQRLGRALQDPAAAAGVLTRSNIKLNVETETLIKTLVGLGRTSEAQGVILGALEGKAKGAGAALRNTLGGALTALKNQTSDLFEGDASSFGNAAAAINNLTETINDPAVKASLDSLGAWLANTGAAALRMAADVVEGMKITANALGVGLDPLEKLMRQREFAKSALQAVNPIVPGAERRRQVIRDEIAALEEQIFALQKRNTLSERYNPVKAAETRPTARLATSAALTSMSGLEEIVVRAERIGEGAAEKIREIEREVLLAALPESKRLAMEWAEAEAEAVAAGVMSGLEKGDIGKRVQEITDEYLAPIEVRVQKIALPEPVLSEFARSMQEHIQRTFADAFMSIGSDDGKTVARNFLDGFKRILAEGAAHDLAKLLKLESLGKGGSVLGGLIGRVSGQKATAAQGGCATECASNVVGQVSTTLGSSVKDLIANVVEPVKMLTAGAWKFLSGTLSKLWEFIKGVLTAIKTLVASSSSGSSGGFVSAIVSGIGSLFGGSAGGGLMPANKPRWVGEEGPELILPGSSMMAMNQRQLAYAGGGGVTLEYSPQYNITNHGVRDEQLLPKIAAYVERQDQKNKVEIMEMLRRNGYGRMTR